MFTGKKILIGITGSIAAYKINLLTRLLTRAGAEVKIVMTPASRDFVSPLTLSTLSKNPVVSELFSEGSWSNHVLLGRWADIFLIAPLSCNTLSKLANGQCDNMLLATYFSATCPVFVAPAMDEDMWNHPVTKLNLQKLVSYGNSIIPVEKGELASGLVGHGRMAEPETIFQFISDHFLLTKDLSGKKILVTAGPTFEPIDPVRFIGNHSTGKTGDAICKELVQRGAQVDLVLGPSNIEIDSPNIIVHRVRTAEEMYQQSIEIFSKVDVAIMSAAVADYTPITKAVEKIKKTEDSFSIELTKTKDILKFLGERKQQGQLIVGFALETNNERENAMQKLKMKNADIIVLNSLNDDGAGFGHDTNKITIFEKNGIELSYERKSKQQVARDIVDRIVKMMYA